MRTSHYFISCYIYCVFAYAVTAFFNKPIEQPKETCFCQLLGSIDDCSCNINTVDYFNNMKLYPRLASLLTKDYFRYYKVNLKRKCPFWTDDSRCAIRHCHVEPCSEHDIPAGIKAGSREHQEHVLERYSEEGQKERCKEDVDDELGYLNTTISAASLEEFERWNAYDSSQDNFCTYDDEDSAAEYVDLLLNPERYTGYRGPSAHRIWHSIYMENCFRPETNYGAYIQSSKLNGMCLEKRVFYRAISGLHASINIHLCSNYLLSDKSSLGIVHQTGFWGPNTEEFERRFNPTTTNNEGPQWLKNLYFVYLLELRALAKAAPYLERELFFTGSTADDQEVRNAVADILSVVRSFPQHFDDKSMFSSGDESRKLKDEFRRQFRNITEIMDCVGCDKCKLWGKLQVQGLGTALKILFSGKFDSEPRTDVLKLQRGEIVSLFNAIGRLSTSIFELDGFRKLHERLHDR